LLATAREQNLVDVAERPPDEDVAGMAELFLDQHGVERGEAAAAKFFRNVHGIEAERFRLLENASRVVARKDTVVLDEAFKRVKLVGNEVLHRGDEEFLLVAEFQIHPFASLSSPTCPASGARAFRKRPGALPAHPATGSWRD